MKASKYNLFYELNNKKKIAFNSTSCALAEVEDEFFNILNGIDKLDISKCDLKTREMIDMMKEGNFIVDDCLDELKQLKFANARGKFSSDTLGLTIAPTLFCNFKCPYCYETPKNHLMNEEIQDAIVDMVKKYSKNIKGLSITWYGGEPLVGKEVIWKLSERFMDICKENNVDYSTYMVTNGYLINEDIIKTLIKCNIKSFQITLDGPPEIHNKRRILKNNNGTFDKIVKNIKLLVESGCNVNIRVNIDKTNINDVEDLLKILKDEGLKDLNINFGQVTAYTDACNSIKNNCLNTKEYSKENIRLQKLLHNYGFKADDYPYYPGIKGNYCCADQVNAFVVDSEGYLYKCWNNVGDTKNAVGNVLELDEPNMEHIMRQIDWVQTNPFEGDCIECSLLPICMGGCPYLKKSEEQSNCEKWKYNFKEMLEYTYQYKTKICNEINE